MLILSSAFYPKSITIVSLQLCRVYFNYFLFRSLAVSLGGIAAAKIKKIGHTIKDKSKRGTAKTEDKKKKEKTDIEPGKEKKQNEKKKDEKEKDEKTREKN